MLKFVLLYQRLFSQQWNAMCIDLLCLLLFSQDFQNNKIVSKIQPRNIFQKIIRKLLKVPQTKVLKGIIFLLFFCDWKWKLSSMKIFKLFFFFNFNFYWFTESYTMVYQDHLSAVQCSFWTLGEKNRALCFSASAFTQAATLLWMCVKILDISGVILRFCPTFIHLSLTLLQCFCTFLKFQDVYILFSVRGSRPGKNVQLTENEIRGLCLKSRELFLSQPILLELEAPLKICGELNLTLPFINHIIMACAIGGIVENTYMYFGWDWESICLT